MINIKVKGHGFFNRYTGKLQVFDSVSVKDVINKIQIKPEMHSSLLIVKNGRVASLTDIVQDKDEIDLFVPISGG